MDYWDALSKLVREHEIIIDRKKGSVHPRYSSVVYPLDSGCFLN